MRDTTHNPLSTTIVAVPLLFGALLAASPVVGAAQPTIGECVVCGPSSFDEDSSKCKGAHGGSADCAQQGTPDDHWCQAHGGDCDTGAAATDQQAIEMVMAREMLPADGGHFFVMDGENAVVMRKCDRSLIARIPLRALESEHAAEDRLAWRGTHARPTGDGTPAPPSGSSNVTAAVGAPLDG